MFIPLALANGVIKIPALHQRTFTVEDCEKNYEKLKKEFSNNKLFFDDIELAALVALSFYPELLDVNIKFLKTDIKTTMETRPKINSVFGKRDNRKYIIYVDNKVNNKFGVLIDNVPFNGLIGLIGHELAHIVDYEKMGVMKLTSLACNYSNDKFKEKFEKDIDVKTIKRGLGWQLHDWADYAMEKSMASKEYKSYKKKFYLQPAEIHRYIEKRLYKNLKDSLKSRNKTKNKE